MGFIVPGVTKSQTRLSDFHFPFSLSCIGEGNGNPLQCSCLENPRDGGAWWAAIYGVAQSQSRLRRSSSSSSRGGLLHSLAQEISCGLTGVEGMKTFKEEKGNLFISKHVWDDKNTDAKMWWRNLRLFWKAIPFFFFFFKRKENFPEEFLPSMYCVAFPFLNQPLG